MVWTFKFQYDNTLSALENASVEVLETFKFQYDNTLRNGKTTNFTAYDNLNSNMIIL